MNEHPAVRILAVDDIESNLVALEAVLQDASMTVVRARSGEDALRALLQEDFALILLDVQMPEMDGFETAAAIRQRRKNSRVPIIFLTAHGTTTEKMARAYAVGAADLLAKPIDEDALRAKVQVIADMWRRVDETKREAAAEHERRIGEERRRWETDALRAQVAEQEKATAAEHAARLQAEDANRIKDEFLATLSHELRTPLNAILGWATTLKRKGLVEQPFARGLDAIERNAKAQAKLIEDLLDASSIMSGKVRLDLQTIAVAAMMEAVIETVRHAAEQKQLLLNVFIEEGLPAIAGDPDRLNQVLTNVLSNAIKFSRDNGQVGIRVERVSSTVRIQVRDNGAGIAPEFLPHVFERFRQGDGATTRIHGGLGIGLSLAQQLVALHGGSIWADSEGPDKGATLTMLLPIAAATTPEANTPMHTADADAPSLSQVRALVVDDEPDARDLVREVLESAGAVVLAVDSAEAAIEACLRWKPDVIVSDIAMPREDGFALIRRLRALPDLAVASIPAAALTAHAGAADVERTRAAGFQSHLAKPVDTSKLVATVAALAGRLRA